MIKKLIFIFIFTFWSNFILANTEYFEQGLNLFKNKKFNEAKFKFEQDIVFNPKTRNHIYICQKYLKIWKKRSARAKSSYSYTSKS